MAITSGSFTAEARAAGGTPGPPAGAPGQGHGGAHGSAPGNPAGNDAAGPATHPTHESMPDAHPVTGTPLPKGTGAGKGTPRRGGRGGR